MYIATHENFADEMKFIISFPDYLAPTSSSDSTQNPIVIREQSYPIDKNAILLDMPQHPSPKQGQEMPRKPIDNTDKNNGQKDTQNKDQSMIQNIDMSMIQSKNQPDTKSKNQPDTQSKDSIISYVIICVHLPNLRDELRESEKSACEHS